MSNNSDINRKAYLETEVYYLKRIFEKIKQLFIRIIIFFKKRFVYFFSFAIFGLLIGYVFYLSFNFTIYETRLIVSSNVVGNDLIVDLVDNLSSNNKTGVKVCVSDYSRIFKISNQQAKSIINVNAVELNKVDSTAKDSISAQRVLIKIQVKDSSILRKISDGLILHLFNNSFVDTNFVITSQKLTKIENAIHSNIIDTCKLNKTSNKNLNENKNTSPDVYTNLSIKEYNTWAANKLLSKISVIDSVMVEKNKMELKKTLLLFLKFFIGLSFIFLFVKYIATDSKFKQNKL